MGNIKHITCHHEKRIKFQFIYLQIKFGRCVCDFVIIQRMLHKLFTPWLNEKKNLNLNKTKNVLQEKVKNDSNHVDVSGETYLNHCDKIWRRRVRQTFQMGHFPKCLHNKWIH